LKEFESVLEMLDPGDTDMVINNDMIERNRFPNGFDINDSSEDLDIEYEDYFINIDEFM